eukprot:5035846-Amphidinium_carterae.2
MCKHVGPEVLGRAKLVLVFHEASLRERWSLLQFLWMLQSSTVSPVIRRQTMVAPILPRQAHRSIDMAVVSLKGSGSSRLRVMSASSVLGWGRSISKRQLQYDPNYPGWEMQGVAKLSHCDLSCLMNFGRLLFGLPSASVSSPLKAAPSA